MATEQAQHPPAAKITRLQQPADAPAASLPTETLAHILNSSLEGLDPWGRQKARMRFARVCVAWYGAVEVGRELVVKDTKVAERRAKSLMKGSAERRDRIRSLSIKIEENGAGRGQRVASLVSACSQIETLQLLGIGRSRLGTSANVLGKPLTNALKTLSKLKSLALDVTYGMNMPTADFFSLIECWPELNTLEFANPLCSLSGGLTGQVPQTSIRRLRLPMHDWGENHLLVALISSSSTTLRHLDLGKSISDRTSLAALRTRSTLPDLLVGVAPQLISFVAVLDFICWDAANHDESDFLVSTLSALKEVKKVALGVLGFSFSAILPLLQPLLHLHTLSISQSNLEAPQGPLRQLTSQAALDFIDGVVK